jgi:hypothetical protein
MNPSKQVVTACSTKFKVKKKYSYILDYFTSDSPIIFTKKKRLVPS